MNKNKLLFEAIEVPIDYIFLIFAGIVAYNLRFTDFIIQNRPVIFDLPFILFLKILILVSLSAIIVFALSGVYNFERRNLQTKISKLFNGLSIFILILIVAFFFNQRLFSSRFIVIFYWFFALLFLSISRIIVHIIYKLLVSRGLFIHRIVVIGNNDNSYKVISEFKRDKSLGIRVIENFDVLKEDTISKLDQLNKETILDEVVLSDTYADKNIINSLVNFCNTHHIIYKYTASLLETKMINFDIDTIGGVPIIEIKGTRLDGWG